MDVDETPVVMLDEAGREYAHEAREHDESRTAGVDGLCERRVETLAAPVGFVIDDPGSDVCLSCAVQACRSRPIADDRAELEGTVGIAGIVDDGLQIAAAAGNQHHDGEFFAAHS